MGNIKNLILFEEERLDSVTEKVEAVIDICYDCMSIYKNWNEIPLEDRMDMVYDQIILMFKELKRGRGVTTYINELRKEEK